MQALEAIDDPATLARAARIFRIAIERNQARRDALRTPECPQAAAMSDSSRAVAASGAVLSAAAARPV